MYRYYIILNIIITCALLYSLHERIYAGRFIIKTKHKRISIFYFVLLILWIFMLGSSLLLGYRRGKSISINEIFLRVIWIEICISNLLSRTSLGITKGGIYSGDSTSSYFTKWRRIKSYTWISDNVIQLETLGRKNKIISKELEVKEEQREEVDKLLNEFINNKDNDINKKINFKLKVSITLIVILMSIGYVNLIKISKPYTVRLREDEAVAILKRTWKPLEELNKEDIKSREDFNKIFEETMSKSIIDNLYEILVDTNKSKDGDIKFKEKLSIPNIYNRKMSMVKAYIKASEYKLENKRVKIEEELIIEESGSSEENESLGYFIRSFYIKNDKGDWILNDITGLESIQFP